MRLWVGSWSWPWSFPLVLILVLVLALVLVLVLVLVLALQGSFKNYTGIDPQTEGGKLIRITGRLGGLASLGPLGAGYLRGSF